MLSNRLLHNDVCSIIDKYVHNSLQSSVNEQLLDITTDIKYACEKVPLWNNSHFIICKTCKKNWTWYSDYEDPICRLCFGKLCNV